MGHLATQTLQLLIWLLLHASLHVQGYMIGPSCSIIGLPGSEKDLGPSIKRSMTEVESMAKLGYRDITKAQEDEFDNSRSQIFPEASKQDLKTIKSTCAIGNILR
jgi:hypothetical protein